MKLPPTHRRALGAALVALAAACAQGAPVADVGAALTAPAIRFVEPSTVDLGAPPNAAVVADLDGDGHPDLVAATGASGVAVALARDGGFAPPRAYPAGNASGLVAGDLDGDGKLDLVVMNEAGVSVLLGKGDGSFGAPRSFATGMPPGAIVVRDFDGDGKLDVTVLDAAGGRVAVLLGKGDGSFQPATSYATIAGRAALLAGDVDGDGKPDLVVVTRSGTLASLFGKGDGTFRSGPASALGHDWNLLASAAGDFNGDGKLDLAIGWQWDRPGFSGAVGVALGNGDGTFRYTGGTRDFGHSLPSAIAVVDLDGDGKLDLVANIARGGVLVTALGKGDGTLDAITYYRAPGALIAAADLDGDGKVDVVAASGSGVTVSAGNGDGTLRGQRAFELDGDPVGRAGRIAVGDFNGDGNADVAVTYDNTAAHVDVLLGDGRGGLRSASSYRVDETSMRSEIAAVDLDGDGVPDLVIAEGLRVLRGSGDGTFREVYRYGPIAASPLAFGDFDGDGRLDAVVWNGRSGLTIMPGKGDGTFAQERQIAVPGGGGVTAVADFNGDGRPDLAVSAGDSLRVLFGKDDGSFVPGQPLAGVRAGVNIVAADLDRDGWIDMVVAHAGDDISTVLLNTGGGAFRVAGTVPSSGQLRIADIDGDGIPDVLVHGGVLVVYRGKGDGTFEAGQVYGAGGSDFAVADFDGDGRPDVVATVGVSCPFVSVLHNVSR
jgi:FG-GAP-like repeat